MYLFVNSLLCPKVMLLARYASIKDRVVEMKKISACFHLSFFVGIEIVIVF